MSTFCFSNPLKFELKISLEFFALELEMLLQ